MELPMTNIDLDLLLQDDSFFCEDFQTTNAFTSPLAVSSPSASSSFSTTSSLNSSPSTTSIATLSPPPMPLSPPFQFSPSPYPVPIVQTISPIIAEPQVGKIVKRKPGRKSLNETPRQKRDKANLSAKRSRAKRKAREDNALEKLGTLEQENVELREQERKLMEEVKYLKDLMFKLANNK